MHEVDESIHVGIGDAKNDGGGRLSGACRRDSGAPSSDSRGSAVESRTGVVNEDYQGVTRARKKNLAVERCLGVNILFVSRGTDDSLFNISRLFRKGREDVINRSTNSPPCCMAKAL